MISIGFTLKEHDTMGRRVSQTRVWIQIVFYLAIGLATTSCQTTSAYSWFRDESGVIASEFPGNVLAQVSVPPGKYVIFAKLRVDQGTGPYYEGDVTNRTGCRLTAGVDFDQSEVSHRNATGAENIGVPIALLVVHDFPNGGGILLTCFMTSGASAAFYSFIKIVALRVDTLSNAFVPRP